MSPSKPEPQRRPLTPWQKKTALAMADLVRYIREAKARAKKSGQRKTRAAEDAIALYNNGFILQDVFKTLGTTALKTVYTWDKKLRRGGDDYRALAPGYGHNRGQFSLTDIEREIFLRELLQPNRPVIGTAIRWTRTVLRSQYGIVSEAANATFRRFAESYRDNNYHIWVLAREGEKALDDKVLPYIERDRNLIEVGDVLVADGHPLNFQVLNPWTGKPCRAVLLMFYDWRSAYPCGFEIKLTEDVQCIQAAFRRAVIALGKVPGHALIDNGKAFKAKVFTSQVDFEQAGIYGLYARLGVKVRFSAAYNAKDKPVERFFKTFNEWVERRVPSYTGASIDDKPAYMKRNEQFHKALHNPVVPTIEQAIKLVQAGIDFYARQEHGGLGGRTPLEVFEEGRGPGVDLGELNHMMMAVDIKKLYRNGVRMFGGHYWDEALVGLKESVIVRYDLEDLGRVLVYDTRGRFLCTAERTYRYDPLMRGSDYSAMKQAGKEKREIKRQITTAVKAAHGLRQKLPIDWEAAVGAIPELPEAVERAADEAELKQYETATPAIEHAEPFFQSEYERYEYLLSRESLTSEEREFMQWYESTEEYQTIFVDLRQQAL